MTNKPKQTRMVLLKEFIEKLKQKKFTGIVEIMFHLGGISCIKRHEEIDLTEKK